MPETARTVPDFHWLDRAAQRNAGDLAAPQLKFQLPIIDKSQRTTPSQSGVELSTAMQPCITDREKLVGPSAHDVRLGRVICELNIGRFKHLLTTDIDAAKRQTVNRLLAEEQFYLKQLLAAGGS